MVSQSWCARCGTAPSETILFSHKTCDSFTCNSVACYNVFVETVMSKTPRASRKNGPKSSEMLQLSGKLHARYTLLNLRKGDVAVLDSIELPADDARRLMELGFLPGTPVTAGESAPGGDPRVFQVDGSEIALRRSTAGHLMIRPKAERKM